MQQILFSILLGACLSVLQLTLGPCQAMERENEWSGARAQDLIQRINTTQDPKAFIEFAQAYNRGVISGAQTKQLIIQSIPEDILKEQNDIKATWLLLSIQMNNDQSSWVQLKLLSKTYSFALNHMGVCYVTGLLKKQDKIKGLKYYRLAVQQGYHFAQLNLAELYYKGEGVKQNFKKAVKWFRKSAEQGNAVAQYSLGICYYYGRGVEQNYGEAVKWYRQAAEQGNAVAQNFLGFCYENGRGVEQNYGEAVKWYRQAAEQGDSNAQNNLGFCYENGRGVEQNYGEAVKLYRQAAEQGNAAAQNNLGSCYYRGYGIKQDYGEAINWLCKAAMQGYEGAQNFLGHCYLNGHGVQKNKKIALSYFFESAIQGYDNSKKKLQELIKVESTKEMTLHIPMAESIEFLKKYLADIRYYTVYWIGLSGDNNLQGTFGEMPILNQKAEKLDALYRKIEKFFPLLDNPRFGLTCLGMKDKDLQEEIDNTGGFFSFIDDYDALRQFYMENHQNVLKEVIQLQEWSKKIDKILSNSILMQSKEVLKGAFIGIEISNPQEAQFIKPFFKHFLEAKTEEEGEEAMKNLKLFFKTFDDVLEKQNRLLTSLGGLLDLKTFSPKQGFLEVFYELMIETAPYRNHVFLEKYKHIFQK